MQQLPTTTTAQQGVVSPSFPSSPAHGSRGSAVAFAFRALRERVPLPVLLDVLARRQREELEQRQRVVERLAMHGAELRATVGGRLEQTPQRFERLFDLMP